MTKPTFGNKKSGEREPKQRILSKAPVRKYQVKRTPPWVGLTFVDVPEFTGHTVLGQTEAEAVTRARVMLSRGGHYEIEIEIVE